MPDKRYGSGTLVAAALVPAIVWQIPGGERLLWPFSILGTWFHEMGHGLTAVLLGGGISSIELFASGGGLSHTVGHSGRLMDAAVSAGGLLGPPVAGFLFLAGSTRGWAARASLYALGAVMLLSCVLWLRTLFGICFVGAAGAAVLAVAWYAPVDLQALLAKLIGVQACVSAYRSRGYMFSSEATVGGALIHSDTAHIAEKLLLPFWVWAALLFTITLALLAGGIYLSLPRERA